MIGWVQSLAGGMESATFYGMIDPLMKLRPGQTYEGLARMTVEELGHALDAALATERAIAEARGRR